MRKKRYRRRRKYIREQGKPYIRKNRIFFGNGQRGSSIFTTALKALAGPILEILSP